MERECLGSRVRAVCIIHDTHKRSCTDGRRQSVLANVHTRAHSHVWRCFAAAHARTHTSGVASQLHTSGVASQLRHARRLPASRSIRARRCAPHLGPGPWRAFDVGKLAVPPKRDARVEFWMVCRCGGTVCSVRTECTCVRTVWTLTTFRLFTDMYIEACPPCPYENPLKNRSRLGIGHGAHWQRRARFGSVRLVLVRRAEMPGVQVCCDDAASGIHPVARL